MYQGNVNDHGIVEVALLVVVGHILGNVLEGRIRKQIQHFLGGIVFTRERIEMDEARVIMADPMQRAAVAVLCCVVCLRGDLFRHRRESS